MLNKLFASVEVGFFCLVLSSSAAASFHLYRINELYSNADGSVQFIELAVGGFDGQSFWTGHTLSVSQGGVSHSFTFPNDLPSTATANTTVLVATQGFADLGIVTPDFIVPAGFLLTGGGTVDFAGVDSVTYAALPTGGNLSMNRDGTTGVNSPKNFAGISGSVSATTTTTTTSTTTTTTATSTTTTLPPVSINLVSGWNLIGNSVNMALDVMTTFGNAANVSTVWKWVTATGKWSFYTPTETDGGAAYAANRGYDFLTTINPGEGFWVNAKQAFAVQLPNGTAIPASFFQDQLTLPNKLPTGWSLIVIGESSTPSDFNKALGASPPSPGTIPTNLNTLWVWNGASSKWFFYAPSLDAKGGTALADNIASKGYLDFTTSGKKLGPGVGFWVSRP